MPYPNSTTKIRTIASRRTKTLLRSLCVWHRTVQIFIARQTLKRKFSARSIFFLLGVICDNHHYFFNLILNELEGLFDLLLICLLRETFRQDLQSLVQSTFLFLPVIFPHFAFNQLLQVIILLLLQHH